MRNKTAHILVAALLLAGIPVLVAAIYWPGLEGPFLLDDGGNIVRGYVDDFDRDQIAYVLSHNTSGVLGRPVSMVSLLFSGIVHGPGPWGYKYHNLMLHLINGLLIFWLLGRLLPRLSGKLQPEQAHIIAGATAAFWLLHPLMVSTVLYAVQRMAELSSFFSLAAVITYVVARESAGKNNVQYFGLLYFIFPIALISALLSKENGALVPFYILTVEFIVFRFYFENSREKTRILVFLALFTILPMLTGVYYLASHFDALVNYSTRDFGMMERLMTQLHVVLFYIKLILLPALSDMSLFHDDWVVVREMDVATWFLLAALSALASLVFYLRKKAPMAAFGIAWFIVSHLMESTFLNLELVFEHRNYLAAVGPLVILSYYLFTAVGNKAIRAVPVIIIALLSFMTFSRVSEWTNPETLYSIAITDHPRSKRAHTAYAALQYSQGNINEAFKHIDISSKLDEKEFGSILHKIVYLCGNGVDTAELFAEANEKARKYFVSPFTFNAIDALLGMVNRGKCPEVKLDQLLDLILAAINQENNRENKQYLGFLHRQAGQIYYLKKEFISGFEYMIQAYENTGLASILAELINYQIQIGELESAEHLIGLLEERDRNSIQSEALKIKEVKKNLTRAKQVLENQRNFSEETCTADIC